MLVFQGVRVRSIPASLTNTPETTIIQNIGFLNGSCLSLGSFRNASLQKSWGYDIHYDAGDEYWMLESDVALYLLPPTNIPGVIGVACCGSRVSSEEILVITGHLRVDAISTQRSVSRAQNNQDVCMG